jgi:hypothetical protein
LVNSYFSYDHTRFYSIAELLNSAGLSFFLTCSIKSTYEGIFDWKLSDEQVTALNGLDDGYRTCVPPWKKWEDDVSYARTASGA